MIILLCCWMPFGAAKVKHWVCKRLCTSVYWTNTGTLWVQIMLNILLVVGDAELSWCYPSSNWVCKHSDCSSLGRVRGYLECNSPVKFLDAFQSSQSSDSGSISTKLCTLPLQLKQHVGNVSSSTGFVPYACVSSFATLTSEFYSSESWEGHIRCELLPYSSPHLSPCDYCTSLP